MFNFKKNYLLLAFLLFVTEVLIALFVHDSIVRPYIGDFLVVMLIYCFAMTFWRARFHIVALSALLFAYLVELTQYFHLVDFLGLQNSGFARTVMGTSFSWTDMLAYTLGIVAVLGIESFRYRKSATKDSFKGHTTPGSTSLPPTRN